MTDREVILLAQSGDKVAAEYLLYKYRNLVRSRTRYFFLSGAETDDLLQIGMIGLWQAITDYRFDYPISFPTFARICIKRHIITAIKTSTRQKQIPLNCSLSLEIPAGEEYEDLILYDILPSSASIDPEEMVLQTENTRNLIELLHQMLSDFEWNVLVRYQVGKTYREISDELHVNTKSVDNALMRIKKKVVNIKLEHINFKQLIHNINPSTYDYGNPV
jgi:RNA polymerase sporulation-specific sigma factor